MVEAKEIAEKKKRDGDKKKWGWKWGAVIGALIAVLVATALTSKNSQKISSFLNNHKICSCSEVISFNFCTFSLYICLQFLCFLLWNSGILQTLCLAAQFQLRNRN